MPLEKTTGVACPLGLTIPRVSIGELGNATLPSWTRWGGVARISFASQLVSTLKRVTNTQSFQKHEAFRVAVSGGSRPGGLIGGVMGCSLGSVQPPGRSARLAVTGNDR